MNFQDLILFKEDILKELKNYKSNISDKINLEFEKYTNLFSKTNEMVENYEKDKIRFFSKVDFIQEKEKILSEFSTKILEIQENLSVNQFNISNCRKDLDNACFKYDKIVTDNLLVSGLIGTACQFKNLKEYILFNKDEINNMIATNKQINIDINSFRKKMEGTSGLLSNNIKSLEYRLSNFFESKYIGLSEKFDKLYEELNKRINSLTNEMSSYLEERKREAKK